MRRTARSRLPSASETRSPLDWADVIRSGLGTDVIDFVSAVTGISIHDLAANLRIPERTLRRRIQQRGVLTADETEKVVRLWRAQERARSLLGAAGLDWLRRPCRGLRSETPLSLLDTADGFIAVMDELGRLEAGVVS